MNEAKYLKYMYNIFSFLLGFGNSCASHLLVLFFVANQCLWACEKRKNRVNRENPFFLDFYGWAMLMAFQTDELNKQMPNWQPNAKARKLSMRVCVCGMKDFWMYASGKNFKMCSKPNAKNLAKAAKKAEKTLRQQEWEK